MVARAKVWRQGPGYHGPAITQAAWGSNWSSGSIPNGHTIVRILLNGSASLAGTAVAPLSTQIPPTMFFLGLKMGTKYFHKWSVATRVTAAEAYDVVTTQRVGYWYLQTDVWDINITPNYKVPASGTNVVNLEVSAEGPNPFVNGTFTVGFNSQLLTMAP
jgi:hypothetical protein